MEGTGQMRADEKDKRRAGEDDNKADIETNTHTSIDHNERSAHDCLTGRDPTYSESRRKEAIESTEILVKSMMAGNDASHDWLHVARVRKLAVNIARDIGEDGQSVDLLVVELAALLHDVFDHKYTATHAAGASEPKVFFEQFFARAVEQGTLTALQVTLVSGIATNVSYSKEQKRIATGTQTAWHQSCVELHCVQDADMLDAMGAIGIMRTVAFACSQKDRVLIVPADAEPADHARAVPPHFGEKLLKLRDCMKTRLGKAEALKRHETMELFLGNLDGEML